MIKFCMLSTKGGVGKTTLAACLGGLLADMGLRVLMIDADIQPSLSKYYPLSHQAPKGLTYIIENGSITHDCISHTNVDGLDIILNDDPEGVIQHRLMHVMKLLRKGMRITVKGRLTVGKFEDRDSGGMRYALQVNADSLSLNLNRVENIEMRAKRRPDTQDNATPAADNDDRPFD